MVCVCGGGGGGERLRIKCGARVSGCGVVRLGWCGER